MTTSPDADAQKSLALQLMLEAWDRALEQGVPPQMLASVAIFAALSDMVDAHGENAVADFCETLAPRIRAGEFTLRGDPGSTGG
mgnify:CR=1 FL=1